MRVLLMSILLGLTSGLLGCGGDKAPVTGEVLMAVEAEEGDRAGEVTFNLEAFERRRIDALEKGMTPQKIDGFRWVPSRPVRALDESEEDFEKKLRTHADQHKKTPWTTPGAWLFLDPDLADMSGGKSGLTADDFSSVKAGTARDGGRAIELEVDPASREFMKTFSNRHLQRVVHLVIDDESVMSAMIVDTLSDRVQIFTGMGGFTETEQKRLISKLTRR